MPANAYRWEAWGFTRDGNVAGMSPRIKVSFSCWDTMTECVRRGIRLDLERGSHFDVSALGSGT